MNNYEQIVNMLIKENKTISTMESCTGGALASAITSIPNSSNIFKFGAVTYSNEYKIKLGVPQEVINKYTVYSTETAEAMSKKIVEYTSSNYGIGVTGQINKQDPNNPYGTIGEVFISIYSKDNDKFYNYKLKADKNTRSENKEAIVNFIAEKLIEIFDIDN